MAELRALSKEKQRRDPRLETKKDLRDFSLKQLSRILFDIPASSVERFQQADPLSLILGSAGGRFGKRGGIDFTPLKSTPLKDIASRELPKLKSIATRRRFTNKMIDTNLKVSLRLLRAEEKAQRAGKRANIELTLGKLDEGTLGFFKKLKELKQDANFERTFLRLKKDLAERTVRGIARATDPKIRGTAKVDAQIRTGTSKRLKALFKKFEKDSITKE